MTRPKSALKHRLSALPQARHQALRLLKESLKYGVRKVITDMTNKTFSEAHCRLVSDVRYGVNFNQLNENFYARMDLLLNLAQFVGGAGAVVAVFGKSPDIAVAVGCLMALCAGIALVWQPAVKAERHRQAKSTFTKLLGKAWALETDDLQAACADLRADAPNGLGSLAVPAHNAMVRAIGYESDVRPLGFGGFIAAAIA